MNSSLKKKLLLAKIKRKVKKDEDNVRYEGNKEVTVGLITIGVSRFMIKHPDGKWRLCNPLFHFRDKFDLSGKPPRDLWAQRHEINRGCMSHSELDKWVDGMNELLEFIGDERRLTLK